MASHFEEEHFFLGEKSNQMVIVTPFIGKLKVHIQQCYVNKNGEKKPDKNGRTLKLKEFDELVKLIPKVQDNNARDTQICSSPSEPELLVFDLDKVFLPSPPSQEPFSIIRDEKLLDSQLKCPSPLPFTPLHVPPPLVKASLENDLDDLNFNAYVQGFLFKMS